MNSDAELGLAEACRRSGLTKHQVRYLESKGYLGRVRRNDANDRRFTASQLQLLERFAVLHASGLGVDDAATIAAEGLLGLPRVSTERLQRLATHNAEGLEARLRTALVLASLLTARLAGTAPQDPQGTAE